MLTTPNKADEIFLVASQCQIFWTPPLPPCPAAHSLCTMVTAHAPRDSQVQKAHSPPLWWVPGGGEGCHHVWPPLLLPLTLASLGMGLPLAQLWAGVGAAGGGGGSQG